MLIRELNETDILTFRVQKEDEGLRLDSVIGSAGVGLSRSRAQQLIEEGRISVNHETETSKKHKVKADDLIEIIIQKEIPLDVEAEDIPLDIVYEDDDLVVINKPEGMVVHPAPGNETGTLVNALLFHCGDSLSSINGVIRPGIVHRIDKDTSGLLVVAKNDDAHRALSKQLADHSMSRKYEAIVLNNIKQDEGTVDAPIGRDPKNRLRNKVMGDGRNAVTHYNVLERFGDYTYLELALETGRTHQIRVHMSDIGHPILGDSLYSNAKNSLGATSQALHARTLGFIHPKTGLYMEFDSSLPCKFEKILSILRKKQ